MEMAPTSACMSKMAASRICVTTPSQSPNSLYPRDSRSEFGYLASLSYRYGLLLLFEERPYVER
jgi:hypothetical protein